MSISGGGGAGHHGTQSHGEWYMRSPSNQRVTPGSGHPDKLSRPPAEELLVDIGFDPAPEVTKLPPRLGNFHQQDKQAHSISCGAYMNELEMLLN